MGDCLKSGGLDSFQIKEKGGLVRKRGVVFLRSFVKFINHLPTNHRSTNNRPLTHQPTDHWLKQKIKKIVRLIKNELSVQIIKEFVRLREKICSQLKDNNDEDKTAKDTKSVP